jgi:hypothetical protein
MGQVDSFLPGAVKLVREKRWSTQKRGVKLFVDRVEADFG